MDLAETVQGLINQRIEGVYWDFKRQHHAKQDKDKLIHDVLCLANADHLGPRFLIFGVVDGSWEIRDIQIDSVRRKQAELADLFRSHASKFAQQSIPEFRLHTVQIEGKSIDVLVISDEPKKPFYLVEPIGQVHAHHIYTRVCDRNTACSESALPHDVERMWQGRLGLDKPAIERARRYLATPREWDLYEDDHDCVVYYHEFFPEFTLRYVDPKDSHLDCNQEWTQGEIRRDNNHAGFYDLYCHQTRLRRIHFVTFDNRKMGAMAPDWSPAGRGRLYFYTADSIEYAVHLFLSSRQRGDDSKVLSIRGASTAAKMARERWGHQYAIPVLAPTELEMFLNHQQYEPTDLDHPATEDDEQYEIFLRTLLDLDDWRRNDEPRQIRV